MKTLVTTMDSEGKILTQQVTETAPHSIEVSRTTRGYTWTIKMYSADDRMGAIVDEIEKIDQVLLQKFYQEDKQQALLDDAMKEHESKGRKK